MDNPPGTHNGWVHTTLHPNRPDGLDGPTVVPSPTPDWGFTYMPRIIESLTEIKPMTTWAGVDYYQITIFWTATTWIPYYAVILNATFNYYPASVSGGGPP